MSGWLTNGVSLATLPFTGNERFLLDTQLAAGALPEMEAGSLSQVASMMGGSLPMAASRFYGLQPGMTPGTLLTVLGTLYAYPYYVAAPVTVKTFGVYTTTGQTGGAAYIGLYADNGAGYPGNLVAGTYNSTSLACTSGAVSQVYTPTGGTVLQAGWYWLASIFTASSTMPTMAANTAVYPASVAAQLGFDTAAHLIATSGQAPNGVTITGQTAGTLLGINSGVFPASATVDYNGQIPLVTLGT